MAKKESTFFNMVSTLFLVTAISAVTLGFVYNATKGPIEEAKQQKLKESINIVVPGADQAEVSDEIAVASIDGGDDLMFYQVTKDGELIGTAIKTWTNNGFSGYMAVMVGLNPDGVIIDSNVLEHKETPGLGDKTCKSVSSWNEQFMGIDPAATNLKVKKDGGDIDAITAATITSRAYCDAIQRACDTYMNWINSETTDIIVTTDKETVEQIESEDMVTDDKNSNVVDNDNVESNMEDINNE
jgi:Na+-translocating ferredoxin:NAD+ oxidoreductase subunit G